MLTVFANSSGDKLQYGGGGTSGEGAGESANGGAEGNCGGDGQDGCCSDGGSVDSSPASGGAVGSSCDDDDGLSVVAMVK